MERWRVTDLVLSGMDIDAIEIRPICESDSIAALTDLLHRAYKPLADAGMRYVASHQDEEITKDRIVDGKCYVALRDSAIIGTVTFKYGVDLKRGDKAKWYTQPGVAYFGQFAVEPTLQGQGIGSRLLALVERKAREAGAIELAFDTSEHAARLIRFYSRRGFRIVEEVDYRPIVNYKSVIMSKRLGDV